MELSTRATIQHLLSLRERSARYEEKAFLVEGKKVLEEARSAGLTIEAAYVSSSFASQHQDYLSILASVPLQQIPEEYISRLSATSTFPGILAVVTMPEITEAKPGAPIACLAGINDPGNLGTMIRTAEWFGVGELLLGPGTVDPYNEKVVRSAMGSLFRSHITQSDDLVADLKARQEAGYRLVAAEAHGQGTRVPDGEPFCLLMGSESHGLPPEVSALADSVYTIPGFGPTESLNVAVSFGIILHQLTLAHA